MNIIIDVLLIEYFNVFLDINKKDGKYKILIVMVFDFIFIRVVGK